MSAFPLLQTLVYHSCVPIQASCQQECTLVQAMLLQSGTLRYHSLVFPHNQRGRGHLGHIPEMDLLNSLDICSRIISHKDPLYTHHLEGLPPGLKILRLRIRESIIRHAVNLCAAAVSKLCPLDEFTICSKLSVRHRAAIEGAFKAAAVNCVLVYEEEVKYRDWVWLAA